MSSYGSESGSGANPDSFFPLSPDSPNAARIHLDDVKQNRLDERVSKTVSEKGGVNYVQAEYVSELCGAVVGSSSEKLFDLQPRIKDLSSDTYYKALCLSIAFLKRYKMTQTVDSLRKEFPQAPKSTGFARASEVDAFFEQLFQQVEKSREDSFYHKARVFEKRVAQMYEVAPAWLDDAKSVRSTRSLRSWKSAKSKQSKKSGRSPQQSPSPRK